MSIAAKSVPLDLWFAMLKFVFFARPTFGRSERRPDLCILGCMTVVRDALGRLISCPIIPGLRWTLARFVPSAWAATSSVLLTLAAW